MSASKSASRLSVSTFHLGAWLAVAISSPQTSEGTASTDPERAALPIWKAISRFSTSTPSTIEDPVGKQTTTVGSPFFSTERLRMPRVSSADHQYLYA